MKPNIKTKPRVLSEIDFITAVKERQNYICQSTNGVGEPVDTSKGKKLLKIHEEILWGGDYWKLHATRRRQRGWIINVMENEYNN